VHHTDEQKREMKDEINSPYNKNKYSPTLRIGFENVTKVQKQNLIPFLKASSFPWIPQPGPRDPRQMNSVRQNQSLKKISAPQQNFSRHGIRFQGQQPE
jgi:hypothetical protein